MSPLRGGCATGREGEGGRFVSCQLSNILAGALGVTMAEIAVQTSSTPRRVSGRRGKIGLPQVNPGLIEGAMVKVKGEKKVREGSLPEDGEMGMGMEMDGAAVIGGWPERVGGGVGESCSWAFCPASFHLASLTPWTPTLLESKTASSNAT